MKLSINGRMQQNSHSYFYRHQLPPPLIHIRNLTSTGIEKSTSNYQFSRSPTNSSVSYCAALVRRHNIDAVFVLSNGQINEM